MFTPRPVCLCAAPSPLLFRYLLIGFGAVLTGGLITPVFLVVLGAGMARAPGTRAVSFVGIATTYTLAWLAAWGYFLGQLSVTALFLALMTSIFGTLLVMSWLPRYRDASMELGGHCRCGAFDGRPDPAFAPRPVELPDPPALQPLHRAEPPRRDGRWGRRRHHTGAWSFEQDSRFPALDGGGPAPSAPRIVSPRRRIPPRPTSRRAI